MKITYCLIFLGFSFALQAQDCTPWFPFKDGASFEYSFYSNKDKLTSRVIYEIKNVVIDGSSYKCSVSSTSYDKKDEEIFNVDFEVLCTDGIYRADLSNFINPYMKESFGNSEIRITGNELEIPKNLKVGETLPDANTHMEAELGIITMKMDMEVTNRKVESKEKVTTPVKAFDAYKVTADEHVKMSIMNRNTQSTYYYAEGYGQVKAEFFDKKGKLDNYMLLTKFSR